MAATAPQRTRAHNVDLDKEIIDAAQRLMHTSGDEGFTIQQLAYLLNKLAAIPEGDGNVLDRCAIYCTSELADGQQHTVTDYPVLVAGKAGGALNVGQHISKPGVRTAAELMLTFSAPA